MTLVEQINEGIKEAMKSRNQVRLDTLRMLKSKILTADARGNLSDAEVQKLFKTYYGSLQESLEQFRAGNREDMANKVQDEMVIVQEFLPKVPSPEETKKIVTDAIAESGAKSKKDLGLVMKSILKINSGVDGKLARDLAVEMLAND